MYLTILIIALGNFISITAGVAVMLYGITGWSVVVGLVFCAIGLSNTWYIRLSSNLVAGFYRSRDWQKTRRKKKSDELVDDDPDHKNRPEKSFLPLLVLGGFALFDALLFFAMTTALVYYSFYDRSLIKAALGSLVMLAYGFALVRYVYWNFRAIAYIRKN